MAQQWVKILNLLRYNWTGAIPYTRPTTQADVVTNCNGFVATNTGNTTVFVNDQPLYPGVPGTTLGDSITVGGNYGEVYTGQIRLKFGVGTTPQVMVNQKFYVI